MPVSIEDSADPSDDTLWIKGNSRIIIGNRSSSPNWRSCRETLLVSWSACQYRRVPDGKNSSAAFRNLKRRCANCWPSSTPTPPTLRRHHPPTHSPPTSPFTRKSPNVAAALSRTSRRTSNRCCLPNGSHGPSTSCLTSAQAVMPRCRLRPGRTIHSPNGSKLSNCRRSRWRLPNIKPTAACVRVVAS